MANVPTNAYLAAAITVGLGLYYYNRAEGVKQMKRADVASQTPTQQLTSSSKFAFVNPKDRFFDQSVWKVNEPGYARQGQYGLERRDYIDPVSKSRIPTYTDSWVNV